ncbi:AbrB/MazE/SpoVT family DNA-binding domain-containing protein [Sphingorhabdus sp.]|jgi:putative addiction module antidote|uniref:AbrB/MazE/SpoVT family DNA-binding domain-containing protein n=1 Tax=Sphingorhabdus sp. TaxID=1902408 RepID=UPI0032B7DBE0
MNAQVKIIKVGNSVGITLPSDIVRRRGLKPGDQLNLADDGLTISLTEPSDDFESQMAAAREVMARRKRALRELAK